jgi:hypothetical protein
VPGQSGVDERVVAVEEIEDGSVPLDDVQHEANRLLKHGFAQLTREAWEPLAVDGVVFLETSNVEPVAGEFSGQMPGAPVLQHPPGLRAEHVRFTQIAGRGAFHQLVVRHARPQEVAQAAGECIVGGSTSGGSLAEARLVFCASEASRRDSKYDASARSPRRRESRLRGRI